MDCVSPPKTVSRMDAGFEPPWMGLRRVFGGDTQFMSRCQCMCLIPLFTTDINLRHLAETRPMLIKLGPSVGARHPHPTTTDSGSAGFAGAKTCHAADGLSKVLQVHISRYYLWDSSGLKTFYNSHYDTTLISRPVKFTEEDILPGR